MDSHSSDLTIARPRLAKLKRSRWTPRGSGEKGGTVVLWRVHIAVHRATVVVFDLFYCWSLYFTLRSPREVTNGVCVRERDVGRERMSIARHVEQSPGAY